MDQYQYLGNCPPTLPLTQQQSIDNKLRLMRWWWDWHALDEEDQINTILDEMYIKNYDDEEKQQNRFEMTDTNAK